MYFDTGTPLPFAVQLWAVRVLVVMLLVRQGRRVAMFEADLVRSA
jgi:hypothetical protein